VKLTAVEIDGKPCANYNADELTVNLPDSNSAVRVKVTIAPVKK